jgi:CubicO group peptidase (beta-lactamase class C family)
MKTPRVTAVIATVLTTFLASPALAQDATGLGTKIDAVMHRGLKSARVPGASLLIAKGAEVLFEKGYGFADIEHEVPVTPETVFRIGSITKQFTAAAIMKLREADKLTVESKLAALAPEFGFTGKPITVHQLLNHTSGIKSFTSLPHFWETATHHSTHEEMFALIKDEPFDFEPGAKMLYNNSGYYLLGVIIEKVAGRTYEEYLTAEFFQPLGMKQTRYGGATPIVKHRARGYTRRGGKNVNAKRMSMRPPFAAGALLSTTRDLHRWNIALHGGKVVSAESYKMMTTPRAPAVRGSGGYGYGLQVPRIDGQRILMHGGGIFGFSTILAYYPKYELTIVLLYNRDQSSPGSLAKKVASLVISDSSKR